MKTMTGIASAGIGALLVFGCAHSPPPKHLEPEAKQAVNASRGLCATDLNQTNMVLNKRPDGYGLIFQTEDASQAEELQKRVLEMGEALSVPHPAVSAQGEKIQHAPLPAPELIEVPRGTGYAVELVMRSEPAERDALKAHLDDHVRMGQHGECPIMIDESVRPGETKQWSKVDR
jgi:hypothetical protein